MRRLIALCLAAAVVLPACFDSGDDGDGSLEPEPEPSSYSGTFYVTYSLLTTDCSVAPPFDGNATIAIEGDTIVWGSMRGPWDEQTLCGAGESVSPTCIPINPSIGCTGCFTTRFSIEYASVDSFSGFFEATFGYTDPCETDSCRAYYLISGARSL